VAHLVGFDWECQTIEDCENQQNGPAKPSFSNSVLGESSDVPNSETEEEEDEEPKPHTYKDDSGLRDQQSTGRKRAAKDFPLDADALCEWSLKKNCGGGVFPIVGCLDNKQQARHHGPDKNTLNNDKGNVHRICHSCHNRWHTLNDIGYVWGNVYDPHSPREANAIDVGMNEEFWKSKRIVKAKD
jgi:hypothetical protein